MLGVGNIQKQMWWIIGAKDLTGAAFKSMEKNAKTAFGAIKKGAQGVKLAILGMAGTILGIGGAALKKMINLGVDLAKGAIEVAAEYEQLNIEFAALLGSADGATKALTDIKKAAQGTPFAFKAMADGARTLITMEVAGKDVSKSIAAVADAAAYAGVDIDSMATAFARFYATGQTMRGGGGKILQVLLKTRMGIDASKASISEVQAALGKLLTDPQYGIVGMASKMSGTFNALKVRFAEAIKGIKKAIADVGLFDEVKGFAQDIIKWLSSDELKKSMQTFGRIVTDVVSDARKKFDDMLKKGQMKDLVEGWVRNMRIVANVLKILIQNIPAIMEVIMSLASGIALAIEKIAQGIAAIMPLVGSFTGKIDDLNDALEASEARSTDLNRSLSNLSAGWANITEDVKNNKNSMEVLDRVWSAFADDAYKQLEFNADKYSVQTSKILKLHEELTDKGGLAPTERAAKYKQFMEEVNALYVRRREEVLAELKLENEKRAAILKEGDLYRKTTGETGKTNENLQKIKAAMAGINTAHDEYNTKVQKTVVDIAMGWYGGLKKLGGAFMEGWNAEIERQKAMKQGEDPSNPFAEPVKPEFLMIGEEWNLMLENMTKKAREEKNQWGEVMVGTAQAGADAFQSLFFDVMTGQFKGLQAYTQQFFQAFMQELSQALARKMMLAMIPGLASGGVVEGMQRGGLVEGRIGVDRIPIMATAGEMVLNKRQQANLHAMLARGSGGGGGGSTTIINNISAMDGQDVFRTLDRNRGALMATLNKSRIGGYRGAR